MVQEMLKYFNRNLQKTLYKHLWNIAS